MSLPFLATTVYGLLRQNSLESALESNSLRSNMALYTVGGALISGASLALKPHKKKVLVKLTYRNSSGAVLDTESQWINPGKSTTINVKSKINGWIDVTITANINQRLQIQRINYISEKTISTEVYKNEENLSRLKQSWGSGGIEASSTLFKNIRRKDAIDLVPNSSAQFGWQNAFSKPDPITLPPIIATTNSYILVCRDQYGCYYQSPYYGEGTGVSGHYEIASGNCPAQWYGFWGVYYLTQQIYNGRECEYEPVDDGDEDDGNDWGNGGSGPAGALDHAYDIGPLNCDAYGALNSYSSSYGKEYGAVITSNGQMIILPAAGNQINKTDFGGVYQDEQGRTIATIYSENGNWYIQTNDFSSGTGQLTVNQITGMIHTHPIGTAPNGMPWDTYNPSSDDINLLNTYSGLNQYISAPDRTFQYNSSGTISNSTAPNSCF